MRYLSNNQSSISPELLRHPVGILVESEYGVIGKKEDDGRERICALGSLM